MKNLFLAFLFMPLLCCEQDQINLSFVDDSSIANINGSWKVIYYQDLAKNSVVLKNDVDSWNGMDVIITFNNDSISGRNTTNSVSGKYSLSGRNIHITSFGGTKMGQPEWGDMFSVVIYSVESYGANQNQMRFYYNNSGKSITFDRYK